MKNFNLKQDLKYNLSIVFSDIIVNYLFDYLWYTCNTINDIGDLRTNITDKLMYNLFENCKDKIDISIRNLI